MGRQKGIPGRRAGRAVSGPDEAGCSTSCVHISTRGVWGTGRLITSLDQQYRSEEDQWQDEQRRDYCCWWACWYRGHRPPGEGELTPRFDLFVSCLPTFIPLVLCLSLASFTRYDSLTLHTGLGVHACGVSFLLTPAIEADAQLYTKAIADRPSSQLVALCDLNSERMKHHQELLKEYGKPPAKEYHPVSSESPMWVELTGRTTSRRCSRRRSWTCLSLRRSTTRTTCTSSQR